jgi:hypothetical protein
MATSAEPAGAVQDEWGVYDARPIGMPALTRALEGEPPAFEGDGLSSAPQSRDAREAEAPGEPLNAAGESALGRGQSGALYTLEAPVTCPECASEITTLRVLRVLRTQVSFTSTLPRRGYVILCPDCERILSAELSGLV